MATPGWTATGQATALAWGAPGDYPKATDPGPTNRGRNLFAGGYQDATSTLTQTIGLAQYGVAIDARQVTFVLSAYLGGYGTQEDNATVSVTWLGATTELGFGRVLGVTAAQRGGVTGLLPREIAGSVPWGPSRWW